MAAHVAGVVIVMVGLLTVTACWADWVPPHPPVTVYIMLQTPADKPVTKPVGLTVAIAELLLLHDPVPPLSTTLLAVYVAVPLTHKGLVPVTDPTLALGFIVTTC